MKKGTPLALVASLLLPAVGSAMPITISAIDSGYYDRDGNALGAPDRDGFTGAYMVGHEQDYRNWFVFDLTNVTGHINSAKLSLDAGYSWEQSTYNVWSVLFDPELLLARESDAAIYTDLGTGKAFGSADVCGMGSEPGACERPQGYYAIEVELNKAALDSLNLASGLWAIGGNLTNKQNEYDYLFASTFYSFGRNLILDVMPVGVPEPTTLSLLAAGLAAGFFGRRRRGRQPPIHDTVSV